MSTPPFPPSNPLPAQQTTASPQSDVASVIVPYKNPQALAAYYLGLFSIIPVLGFFLALASVPLGILGLKARSRQPAIHGAAHAWIGIVIGSLSLLVHVAVIVILVIAATSSAASHR